MHFFKTLCFTDYNHFSVVRHISLLSFLHYMMNQKTENSEEERDGAENQTLITKYN